MVGTQQVDLLYLAGSGLDLAHPTDDVRGMVVVDVSGHRLGEVEDLLIDTSESRARLLSVVSGGILGLDVTERLIPVEAVSRVDDRVHVVWNTAVDVVARPEAVRQQSQLDQPALNAVYDSYGVQPFWDTGRTAAYFHGR